MGLADQPSLSVQILLSRDKEADTAISSIPVYYCGEKISGHLRVLTSYDLYFEIILSFEGHVKTWLGSARECRFLKQTQCVQKDIGLRCSQKGLHVYHLPFHFIIPHESISVHGNVNSQFLRLPPSTTSGTTHFDPRRGYPQIRYFIQVAHIRTDVAVDPYIDRRTLRYINIMPYTSAAPPLWIADFPQEYRTCTMQALKQRKWNQNLGHIEISALEPNPINLLTPAPRASTVLPLRLRFTSCTLSERDSCRPSDWSSLVTYYLRIQTFSSTQKLDRIPTLSATRTDPSLGMREKKTRSEAREYRSICWTREHLAESKAGDREERLDEVWTAALEVPVNVSKSLSPSFLSILSARRYAIVLRIAIEDLHHGALELILPVQLIYAPPDGIYRLLEDDPPSIGNDISCTDVWQSEDPLPSYDID